MKIIKRFISKLRMDSFWKSIGILVSGNIIGQMINVFSIPVVSRIYSPKDFGEFAIFSSTATIILFLVTLGLNSAIMVSTDEEESKDVFMVAFYTMFALSTFVVLSMILISPYAKFYDSGMNYVLSTTLMYFFVLVNNTKGLLSIYANRKGLNRVLFYNSLISALGTLLITIPLGLFKFGSYGLIIATLIAGLVAIAQMTYHTKPFRKITSLSTVLNILKKYKEFIYYQYPSNIIENLSVQLPTQTFSAVFGNVQLGAYSMNEKILGMPSRLLVGPISTVYFRTASSYHRDGKSLAKLTFSLVTKLMMIAFIPVLSIILWGEQIFSFVLGSSWGVAGKMAGILIIQYLFLFCSNCTSYCRVAIGRQKINLLFSVLRLMVISLSIFIGIYFFGDVYNTIVVFSIFSSLYLIIDMTTNFYLIGKYWLKYLLFSLFYLAILISVWILTVI